jgi:hypothetical protein
MTANTVLRCQLLAGLPAAGMEPATALAEEHEPTDAPARAADDPVFAAIERCRAAMEEWERSLTGDDEALSVQVLLAADNALLTWLTTAPTTMAGAIATLEYAATRDCECTILLESAHYYGERLAAAEQFPAMIAAALRKIAGS